MIMMCGTIRLKIYSVKGKYGFLPICHPNVRICADFPARQYLLIFLSPIADILHF